MDNTNKIKIGGENPPPTGERPTPPPPPPAVKNQTVILANEKTAKFIAVCQHCSAYNREDPVFEINFKESSIYYLCSSCHKQNKMTIKGTPTPLPKTGLSR